MGDVAHEFNEKRDFQSVFAVDGTIDLHYAECQHFSGYTVDASQKTLSAVWALKATTLPSVVYRHLHQLIISGRIRPGQKVKESVLAAEMGVSRGPVREACRQLLSCGLLIAEAQRGFFVRSYSPEEASELTVVRAHLSELVGRLATPRMTKDDIQELKAIITSIRQAAERSAVGDFYDRSFSFYEKICRTVGNKKLEEYYFDVSCRTRLFRIMAHPPAEKMTAEIAALFEAGIGRRVKVIKALNTRDAEAVGAALRRNVEDSFIDSQRMYLARATAAAKRGNAA